MAIKPLLVNDNDGVCAVRWSTAFTLDEFAKLKKPINSKLIPKLEALSAAELENGVKKKYLDALKKCKK